MSSTREVCKKCGRTFDYYDFQDCPICYPESAPQGETGVPETGASDGQVGSPRPSQPPATADHEPSAAQIRPEREKAVAELGKGSQAALVVSERDSASASGPTPRTDIGMEPKEILASRLIDAWCETKGGKIPWAKAVQIVAIVTGQPDTERDRLLHISDEDGSCEMCGRNAIDLERRLSAANAARRVSEERDSEQVSQFLDPTVNAPFMRCSPDLPSYIAALEDAADVQQSADGIVMGNVRDLRESLETANAALEAERKNNGAVPCCQDFANCTTRCEPKAQHFKARVRELEAQIATARAEERESVAVYLQLQGWEREAAAIRALKD